MGVIHELLNVVVPHLGIGLDRTPVSPNDLSSNIYSISVSHLLRTGIKHHF